MKNISQQKYLDIDITMPSLQVQEQFADYFKVVLRDIVVNQETASISLSDLLSTLSARAFTGQLTDQWRSRNSSDIAEMAVNRDILLGLRGEEPTVGDYEAGRVTQAEREEIERMLSESMKSLVESMAISFQSPLPSLLKTVQESWNDQLAGIFNTAAAIDFPDFSETVSKQVSSTLLGINTAQFSALSTMNLGLTNDLMSNLAFPLNSIFGNMIEQFDEWNIDDHPRYDVLSELSLEQFRVFLACEKEAGVFTADTIQERVNESRDTIRRALDLFASLGLIVPVSILAQSSAGPIYTPAFRLASSDDEVRLVDLELLEEGQP